MDHVTCRYEWSFDLDHFGNNHSGAPDGVQNRIENGVWTPTRALTKITDRWETWVENTKKRNPMRRTTTPNDVANTVKLLLETEADFINCSIIYCDGGEHRSGSF